jgi:hypothetical protein
MDAAATPKALLTAMVLPQVERLMEPIITAILASSKSREQTTPCGFVHCTAIAILLSHNHHRCISHRKNTPYVFSNTNFGPTTTRARSKALLNQ